MGWDYYIPCLLDMPRDKWITEVGNNKEKDYEKEILAYLEEHEVNGLVLKDRLRMRPDKLYNALISLESAGKIRFIQNPSQVDGYWKLV